MPVWVEEIDIKKFIVLDHQVTVQTDEGIEEFEGIKRNVAAALRGSRFARSEEWIIKQRELTDRDEAFDPAVLLEMLVQDLEKAGSPQKFTQELQYVYMWADKHRVWLGD